MWLIKNRNLFLILFEAESPKSGCQAWLVLGKAAFQFVECWLLTMSSCGRKGWGTCIRALTPFMRAPWHPPPSLAVYSVSLSFSFQGRMIVPTPYGCYKVSRDNPSKMLCTVLGIQRCSLNVSSYHYSGFTKVA